MNQPLTPGSSHRHQPFHNACNPIIALLHEKSSLPRSSFPWEWQDASVSGQIHLWGSSVAHALLWPCVCMMKGSKSSGVHCPAYSAFLVGKSLSRSDLNCPHQYSRGTSIPSHSSPVIRVADKPAVEEQTLSSIRIMRIIQHPGYRSEVRFGYKHNVKKGGNDHKRRRVD